MSANVYGWSAFCNEIALFVQEIGIRFDHHSMQYAEYAIVRIAGIVQNLIDIQQALV